MNRTWTRGVAVLLLCSCDELLRIRVQETAQTTVPARSAVEALLGDFGFDAFQGLDITASEELANQGVAPGDIVDTRVVRFDLAVRSPEGADFDFLDALEVSVEAPGLPNRTIASLDPFPEGAQAVSLDLVDVDITDYVVSERMTVQTNARGRRPEEATTVEADFALSVGVTSKGACNAVSRGQEG